MFTKALYEKLLLIKDLRYLQDILQILSKIQSGPTFDELSLIPLMNQEEILPIYRDNSEEGCKRSVYIMNYKELSRKVAAISPRDGGIKDNNPDFPWDALEKLELILSALENNPQRISQIIEIFANDLLELRQRIEEILKKEQLKIKQSGALEDFLYQEIKFKSGNSKTKTGLKHIRKIVESFADYELLLKINNLLRALRDCDPDYKQGREAILAIAQIIGELCSQVSLTVKNIYRDFPFAQLKQLRHEITHAWDFSDKAEFMFALVDDASKTQLFVELRYALLDLTNQFFDFLHDVSVNRDAILQNTSFESLQQLPEVNHPEPVILEGKLTQQDIMKLLDVIKRALSPEQQNTADVAEKLELCQKLFTGQLPIPKIEEERGRLLGGRGYRESNIDKFFGVKILESLQRNNYDNRPRQEINEDVRFYIACCKNLTYQQAPSESKRCEKTLTEIENFITSIKNAPKKGTQIWSYEEYQMQNLLKALQQINIWTSQTLQTAGDDPYKIRELCRCNSQHHYAVIYNMNIIGQSIQNLKEKEAFRTFTSPFLRKELEALRKIRNALLHNQTIDEAGSELQYFGNDLICSTLQIDGGRAYDSDAYLQSLTVEIDKTINDINLYYQRNIIPISFFYDPNVEVGSTLSLQANESPYIKVLLIQQLRQAVDNHDNSFIKHLLKILDVKLTGKLEPIFKAKKILSMKYAVTLKDLYCYENDIVGLSKQYGVNIVGVFGKLVKYGITTEYDHNSGFLVALAENRQQLDLAYFKRDLLNLLGKDFLVITEDDIHEYQQHKKADLDIAEFITKARQHSFARVMGSYKLFLAVENRDMAAVKQLIPLGLDLEQNVFGYNALHSACHDCVNGCVVGENLAIAELLLQHGSNPNQFDKHGCAPLHYAAIEGNEELAALMLHYGADPNLRDKEGGLALELVTKHSGNMTIYHKLLNVTNIPPLEKLIMAIRINDKGLIKDILLQYSEIDINQTNDDGELAFNVACEVGDTEVINLLLQKRVNIHAVDDRGDTGLHKACDANNPKPGIINKLLNLGINQDTRNNFGDTALNKAVHCHDPEISVLLLSRGANPDIPDNLSFTPLLSILNGNRCNFRIAQALIVGGAGLEIESKSVGNALHHAAERGYVEEAKLLLKYGADPLKSSNGFAFKGNSAYQIALQKGHYQLAKLLQDKIDGKDISDEEMAESVFGCQCNTAKVFGM